MIGVASKIGEFFASLMWAVFATTMKMLVAGVLALGLLLAGLFVLQYFLSRRDGGDQ
jgi:hypothetical protein